VRFMRRTEEEHIKNVLGVLRILDAIAAKSRSLNSKHKTAQISRRRDLASRQSFRFQEQVTRFHDRGFLVLLCKSDESAKAGFKSKSLGW
jgi:hypothetical protein